MTVTASGSGWKGCTRGSSAAAHAAPTCARSKSGKRAGLCCGSRDSHVLASLHFLPSEGAAVKNVVTGSPPAPTAGPGQAAGCPRATLLHPRGVRSLAPPWAGTCGPSRPPPSCAAPLPAPSQRVVAEGHLGGGPSRASAEGHLGGGHSRASALGSTGPCLERVSSGAHRHIVSHHETQDHRQTASAHGENSLKFSIVSKSLAS